MKYLAPLWLVIAMSTSLTLAQGTYFYTGFEYDQPDVETSEIQFLEAIDLNGSLGQVGRWSGDDFPEADATGFFSGGVNGGDSAGLVTNPHGGTMLFVDRPLNDAIHFMELTNPIPLEGAEFSLTFGTRRTGGGGNKDYEFFGLDSDGNRSFHIRIGTDSSTERIGYVAGSENVWDLPTPDGEDAVGDVANTGLPPLETSDDLARLNVRMRGDGFQLGYVNLNGSNAWTSSAIPYNGSASELTRVAMFYRGDADVNLQSGFFLDEMTVTGAGGFLAGDFDFDSDVDFGDFLLLSANFGQTTSVGDFDANGIVEFADFLGFSDAFSKFNNAAGAAINVVPEPNSAWLSLSGTLLLLTFRIRRRR